MWTCNATAAQGWTAQSNGTLQNTKSGPCLDADGSATSDGGTGLVIDTCSTAGTEVFTLPAD
ncbi:RICIN domain-containing protein [Streptacidiphilus sp. P02-A3a]|nr:RICIN domain-containing protein [Streptacidiphilus sp. P02-A3a]